MSLRRLIGTFGGFALPLLHRFDAETAHGLTIAALQGVPPLPAAAPDDPRLGVDAFGLRFPNPLGIAAGFDKNAEVPDALLGLGFGFAEVGTLTPLAQPGNPKPRMFRLPADEARDQPARLQQRGPCGRRCGGCRRATGARGVVGVNIGANKDSGGPGRRLRAGHRGASRTSPSYFTVNVSSPNTPGLRDLQHEAALDDLLARVIAARDEAARTRRAGAAEDRAGSRPRGPRRRRRRRATPRRRRPDRLQHDDHRGRPAARQPRRRASRAAFPARPLFSLSTRMLAETFLRVEGAFALIGVGGIHSAAQRLAKIEAGASLVQLYSAHGLCRGRRSWARSRPGSSQRVGRERAPGSRRWSAARLPAMCAEPFGPTESGAFSSRDR